MNYTIGEKKRIQFNVFEKICKEVSAEMVVSLMALLHDLLPCSINLLKMKENFEKVLNEKNKNSEEEKKEVIPVKRMSSYLASTNILTKLPQKSSFAGMPKKKVQIENSSDSEDAESEDGEDKSNTSLNYNHKSDSQALNHLIKEEESK